MFGMDDVISGVFGLGGKIIDRVWQDPATKDAAKLEWAKMLQTGELADLTAETDLAKLQIELDKAEALGGDKFSSRWRPMIGYVCGGAFAWNFVLQPMLNWFAASMGHPVNAPALDMSTMLPVLLGMLGLGGMRTFERVKGTIK